MAGRIARHRPPSPATRLTRSGKGVKSHEPEQACGWHWNKRGRYRYDDFERRLNQHSETDMNGCFLLLVSRFVHETKGKELEAMQG